MQKGFLPRSFPTNQTFEKFLRTAFMAFSAAKRACSASPLRSFSDVKLRSTICDCVAAKFKFLPLTSFVYNAAVLVISRYVIASVASTKENPDSLVVLVTKQN